MERSSTSPDAWIASLPDDQRPDIELLDRTIAGAMPGHERVLWAGVFWGGTEQRIVGYGAWQAVERSGPPVDWFLIGLARQKRHISVYVNAVEDGRYLVQAYADRLGKVRVGSANVAFQRAADLDLTVLAELVTRALAVSASNLGASTEARDR
jgi:hypothetical protein